jgi:hypothetical protein
MFNSIVLDVVIGLALVFILVSTVCTAIREAIESVLKTRAAYLECAIRELFRDPEGTGMARKFFEHPLISGLFKNAYRARPLEPTLLARGNDMPSYIPSRNFAATLIDLAAHGVELDAAAGPHEITLDGLRQGAAKLENGFVRRAVIAAIDAGQGDLEAVREHLEAWYDAAMDRVSGWYKRTSQVIIAVIALAIVGALNLDAIAIADSLYRDPAVRAAAVAEAEQIKPDGLGAKPSLTKLDRLHLPVGWRAAVTNSQAHANSRTALAYTVMMKCLGLLLTAFAATLGAPFWFDVLNKVMVIRATVKPREKSREEGSEDRPVTPATTTAVIRIEAGDGLKHIALDAASAQNDVAHAKSNGGAEAST